MKKGKGLIVLTCLVAALFIIYFVLQNVATKNASEQTQTDVVVYTLESDIEEISITANDAWTIVKADSQWHWQEDGDFPLNSYYANEMVSNLQELHASSKILDSVSNPSDYGLNSPQNVVSFTTAKGETKTITFGDTNSHTGETYLQVSGDDGLYMVSADVVSVFNMSLYNMISIETWPITSSTSISALTIRNDENYLRLDVAVADDEAETRTYTVLENDTAISANATSSRSLLDAVSSLYITGCVDYKASDEVLAELGLLNPTKSITVTYTDYLDEVQTLTLYIGNGSAETTYFVKTDNSTAVNTIDGEYLAEVLGANLESLQNAG